MCLNLQNKLDHNNKQMMDEFWIVILSVHMIIVRVTHMNEQSRVAHD